MTCPFPDFVLTGGGICTRARLLGFLHSSSEAPTEKKKMNKKIPQHVLMLLPSAVSNKDKRKTGSFLTHSIA